MTAPLFAIVIGGPLFFAAVAFVDSVRREMRRLDGDPAYRAKVMGR